MINNNKKIIIGQFICGSIENLLAIVLVYLNAKMIDEVIGLDFQEFIKIIPKLMGIFILQIIFLHEENFFAIKLKCNYGRQIRKRIYESLMVRDDLEIKAGEVLNIFNSSIGQVQDYIVQIANIGIYAFTLIVAAIYMIRINIVLFAASVVLIPFLGLFYNKINIPVSEASGKIIKSKQRINRSVKDIIEGFYVIKAYSLESVFRNKFDTEADELLCNEKNKNHLNAWISRVGIILVYVPHLIVPIIGGWLCLKGQLTVGDITAANIIVWYITSPLNAIIQFGKTKSSMLPIIKEIESYDVNSIIIGANLKNSSNKEGLVISELFFSYENNKIFDHFNLKIDAKEHVVFMGKSGVGKSTLANILCAIKPEYTGTIELNGMILNSQTTQWWRDKIAYVPQKPHVFGMSLRDNICMGKDISEEKLDRILDISGVKDYVKDFSNGLDTRLGDGGIILSGGQTKKMSIARMLTNDAEVYVMDEPFAGLDLESSNSIQQKLSEYLRDKIVIIVSHQRLDNWNNKIRYIRV